jgi:hypothetical protein
VNQRTRLSKERGFPWKGTALQAAEKVGFGADLQTSG